jgi:small subunit ribosomal protein S1
MVELYRLEINEREEEKQDAWQDLYSAFQNKTILQGNITGIEEYNIDGQKVYNLVVMFDNIKGIILQNESGILNYPVDKDGQKKTKLTKKEQISIKKQLLKLIGQSEPVKVTEVIRDEDKVILSREAALEQMKKFTWSKLNKGMVATGKVRQVTQKGVVIEIGGLLANIPREELSWSFVTDPWLYLTNGQKAKVIITEIDKENNEITASLREYMHNPWPDCVKRYTKSNLYRGKVTKVIEQAVFVNLEPGVDVYCRHMKFERVKRNDLVIVKINGIDAKNKSIWGKLVSQLPTT